MSTVSIYGRSDDLIEIDGGGFRAEFSGGDEPKYLAFSDGTLLRVSYDDEGCWRIAVHNKGESKVTHTPSEGPDTEEYSDRVTLTPAPKWVVCGDEFARKVKAQ